MCDRLSMCRTNCRRSSTTIETNDSLVASYREVCEASNRIAAAYALDDFAMHNRRGPLSVRWMNAHMIEELARHAGHGDILREQILETEGWAV